MGTEYTQRLRDWGYRHRITLLFLAVFLVGLYLRTIPLRYGQFHWDETVYLQHAEILIGERANTYNEFDLRPPMISLILAGVFLLTDSITAAHITVSVLSALGIPLLYLLGRELYGTSAGMLAAVVYMASPLHIFESHMLHIDPVLPTVWLLVALFGYRMLDGRAVWYAVLAGTFTGVAVLSKFTSLVLVPLLVLLLFLDHGERRNWDLSLNGFFATLSMFLHDRRLWQYITGFAVILAPYLYWSSTAFGHPLYPFLQGAELSGAAQPFLTYVQGYNEFIALPFYLGVLLFIPLLRRITDRSVYYPLMFMLVLFVPMQFMIDNKELRYLLPIVPFLALLAGQGLNRIRSEVRARSIEWVPDPRMVAVLVAILLAASLLFVPDDIQPHIDMSTRGDLSYHEPYTPTHDAAMWMKEYTDFDAVLYTNYEWPVLAYYSQRPITLMPMTRPFQHELENYMTEPGYMFLTERAPPAYEPSIRFAFEDDRFEQVASFGDGDTYLFRYVPEDYTGDGANIAA